MIIERLANLTFIFPLNTILRDKSVFQNVTESNQVLFQRGRENRSVVTDFITYHQHMMKNDITVTVAAPLLSQCCVNRFIFYWCLSWWGLFFTGMWEIISFMSLLVLFKWGGNLPPKAQKEKAKLNQTKSCTLLFSQPLVLFSRICLP